MRALRLALSVLLLLALAGPAHAQFFGGGGSVFDTSCNADTFLTGYDVSGDPICTAVNLDSAQVANTLPRTKLGSGAAFDDQLNSLGLGGSPSATPGELKFYGSSSGAATVKAQAAAGTPTLSLPTATGTLVGTGDTGSVTSDMLAGSIADSKLSTISTAGKVSNSATTATNANTAGAIVARDGSGNFSAGTITASLTGTASNASALGNKTFADPGPIGSSTPSTGAFITVTSPTLIGGTGTTSSLTYKTTTGVGASGADHIFLVGNNGATEAMRILNNGDIGIGTSPAVALHVTRDGITASGNFKENFVVQNAAATAGFAFGYDASAVLGVIASTNSNSGISLWTNDGSLKERVRLPSTGGLRIGPTALTLTDGALGMNKITASASAPGAAGGKLELVCGTNAGSAKLIAYAGTSSTAVTILDNIGSGVTGC